jgi:hypothetical protein
MTNKPTLTYIVRIQVWEDTPKVRSDMEARLNKICGLAFDGVGVEDANREDDPFTCDCGNSSLNRV